MTYATNMKQMALAVSCALTLGAASGAARAEINPADTGYLTDQRDTVVRSGYGLCWHTGTGPAAVRDCDATVSNVPSPPVARVAEPLPKPVALAAVTPAPQPAPAPVTERVTLDADALFDFEKAVLRPAGRQALDAFFGKIQDINPDMIMAVGHADRFGSEAYNQRLSEQRVEAVKAYLVGKGIEPIRVHTEGKGEMQPVTKAGECAGTKSAAVIACLQPDRRVEVEVTGTRIVR